MIATLASPVDVTLSQLSPLERLRQAREMLNDELIDDADYARIKAEVMGE